MRRTAPGRQLAKYARWKKYESTFAVGLQVRRSLQDEGLEVGEATFAYPRALEIYWAAPLAKLVARFDEGVKHEHQRGGEAS
jgi:hypothetical protein